MRFQPRSLLAVVVLLALAVGPSGCIGDILADGQIAATRKAAAAVNTIADYELQRSATQAGLAQFEGMHLLRPGNEDALFLLTQAWGGYAYAFPQDEYEDALDAGQDDLAAYHKKRARLAYDRAIFFGLELLAHRADGFDAARRNADTLSAWLKDHFTSTEDAARLSGSATHGYRAWTLPRRPGDGGRPLRGRRLDGTLRRDRPDARALERNDRARCVPRPPGRRDRPSEADVRARPREDGRKSLQVQLNYATSYACMKTDRAQYETLLNEVLAATDPDPEQRLVNLLAKRRARALTKSRWWMRLRHVVAQARRALGRTGSRPAAPGHPDSRRTVPPALIGLSHAPTLSRSRGPGHHVRHDGKSAPRPRGPDHFDGGHPRARRVALGQSLQGLEEGGQPSHQRRARPTVLLERAAG